MVVQHQKTVRRAISGPRLDNLLVLLVLNKSSKKSLSIPEVGLGFLAVHHPQLVVGGDHYYQVDEQKHQQPVEIPSFGDLRRAE